MKILNLHGFMGEADNKNYKALYEIFSAENIISPQLHYKENSPQEILDMLSALVDSEKFIFVGQSLGGWFADKLSRKFGCPCILTNPCYYPHELGIIRDSGISAEFVEQYREMSVHNKNERAYTLCSDADTILPSNDKNCMKLSQYVTSVHGSHSTIENVGKHLSALIGGAITASFRTIATLPDHAVERCPSLKIAVIDGIEFPLHGKFDTDDVYKIAKKLAKHGSQEADRYLKGLIETSKNDL